MSGNWSNYFVLAMLLVIFVTIGIVGTHFGYTVNGIPKGGEITYNGLFSYLWNFVSFQIDGMPAFLSAIFDIMIIVFAFVIVHSFGTAGLIVAGIAGLLGVVVHFLTS